MHARRTTASAPSWTQRPRHRKWSKQEKLDRGEIEGLSTDQGVELAAARRRIYQLETELAENVWLVGEPATTEVFRVPRGACDLGAIPRNGGGNHAPSGVQPDGDLVDEEVGVHVGAQREGRVLR